MAIHHSLSHLCPPLSLKAAFKGNYDIPKSQIQHAQLWYNCVCAAKGTQEHMARGRDPPLPKIPFQMREVLGSSVGEVRQLPPTLYLLCEETEGLQDCPDSTIHKQFKRFYIANKNKIALYNKVLPHTHTEYVQPLGNVSKRCFLSNCMLKAIY